MDAVKLLDSAAVAPDRVIVAPVSWFAGTWENRPKNGVAIGLRVLSAMQKTRISDLALERTRENKSPDGDIAVYNRTVVYLVAAFGICDPNDVREPCELFFAPEEQVFFALTEPGAKNIFDAIAQLESETSPYTPRATPEDIARLYQYLNMDILRVLPTVARDKVATQIRIVLNTIEEHAPQQFINETIDAVALARRDVP